MRALKRILRVRKLREEIVRMELESETGRLAALDRSAADAKQEARQSRRASFASMGREGDSGWVVEEAAWQLAGRRERRLQTERPALAKRVEGLRSDFLASRREKLQVETLMAEERERRQTERLKREQSTLDEWFSRRRGPGVIRAERQPERP